MGYHYECRASSVHVLTINPHRHYIIPVKASGRETVKSLAKQYNAVAAVNGGFWKSDGSPAGILKINHHWYGLPRKNRAAIGWSNGGKQVILDRISTKLFPEFTDPEFWHECEHIVGGTPLLLFQGNLIEDYSSEQTLQSFLSKNHPRTAVGIKENGDWVFVLVQSGLPIKELAQLMQQLGCRDALNLDGGGSATMVIEDLVFTGGFLERAVSDAILIL